MKVFLFALAVCVVISYTSGLVLTDLGKCPLNCATMHCWTLGGCSQCVKGYCLQLNNKRYGVCRKVCPRGTFCNKNNFCSKCRMRYCEDCTMTYDCTRCRRGYTYVTKQRQCMRRWASHYFNFVKVKPKLP